MATKQFAVLQTRERQNMPDALKVVTGTVEEITAYFGYTLECGNSWNKKINKNPKTIKSLVTNINNSYNETQSGCYKRTFVQQISMEEAEKYNKQ